MITAVDSNILLDVFLKDSEFMLRSRAGLRRCGSEGALVACDVVWAEVGAHFPTPKEAGDVLDSVVLDYSALERGASLEAGHRWKQYRREGGPRTRIISDFLVGAHALLQADRLLSRDRGFYRTCFKDLIVVDPSRE